MQRILCLLIFVFISSSIIAQPSSKQLDSLLQVVASEEGFNGNVLVSKNGEVVYQGSFGYANFDTKAPLNKETSFRLASISKQFTALGIALLENDGKLSFDDPLIKYIPQLDRYPDVTLRHLIHHYGGLPDYMRLVRRNGNKELVYDNAMVVALMAKKQPKPLFDAGESSSYSNTGYLLLASVIEQVSGKPYGDFLEERIFKPLKMSRTVVNFPRVRDDANIATGFKPHPKTGKMINADNEDSPMGYHILADVVGDGAVYSTTEDLLRYHQGMQTDILLPSAKREVLVTAGVLEKAPDNGYAFGQHVRSTKALGQRIFHGGSWAGALTWLERYPDDGSFIAILSNSDSDFTTVRLLARQLLTGDPLVIPKRYSATKVTANALQGYAGDYFLDDKAFSSKLMFTITTKGNKLKMQPAGQPNYTMTPYADDGFFLKGTNISIEFNRNANGEVPSLIYTQDGKSAKCLRQ